MANELSYFSQNMKSYLKSKTTDEFPHRDLWYWVSQKIREEMEQTNETRVLLNKLFDEKVHGQIQSSLEHREGLDNHVDLDCWLVMLVKTNVLTKNHKKTVDKFIHSDKPTNKCFVIKNSFGSDGDIKGANLTGKELESFLKNNKMFDDLDSENQKKWLFHGTSHQSAENIRTAGISLLKSEQKTDFGPGFYLSRNFRDAKEWSSTAPKGGKGAVLIYESPIQEDLKMLNLMADHPMWEKLVSIFRGKTNVEVEREVLLKLQQEKYDWIFGKMSGDRTDPKKGDDKWTPKPTRKTQYCVKSVELAKILESNLKGIIYME